MPIFEVSDPKTGKTLELEGDSPPTEQELEQLFYEHNSPDYLGAGIVEPVRAVASGIEKSIVGGLAGTAQAINPLAEQGAGAQAVKDIQSTAFQPETKAGKEGMQTLNNLMQKGVDIANIPLSGLGGIIELISGQGLDRAVNTIKSIQDSGISKTMGARAFDETGSPLAATIAETAPTAIASAIGMGGAVKTASNIRNGVEATASLASKAASKAFKYQTPTKQKIAALIGDGSGDISTARFVLDNGRAVKDRFAINAIDQGFDEGVIAAIKNASATDKVNMQRMVDIMQRGKKNARYAIVNRPSDIAGDSLVKRIKFLKEVNRSAGSDIDKIALGLKGKPVDLSAPVSKFADALDSFGIKITRNDKGEFVPDFRMSEVAPGDRGPIKEVIRQMSIKSQNGSIDALAAHKMKRIIDRNVTFGKVKTGLSGDTERVLKEFRREIDGVLDSDFPDYNAVNVKYSETINAIGSVQDAAGRKLDFSSPVADKASGTALRRLMGNTQSRANLIDALDEVGRVVKNNGGNFQDDLLNQALFADELDRVFGPVARTSLQGQMDQALKQGVNAATTKAGAVDAALSVAGKVADKARGINEESAFRSINDLLREKR